MRTARLPAAPSPGSAAGGFAAVLLGVLLIAANMRPAFTSVGPVLPEIRADLGLSGTAAALLTGLPVVCLGILAPVAPALSRLLGVERAIGVGLATLALGATLRSLDGFDAMILGTIVVGGGIAVINVLLPVVVKRDFPDRAGQVTGLYTASMAITAAAAAAITLPLGDALGLGWRGGLAAWALPVLVALVAWAPQMSARVESVSLRVPTGLGTMLRDPLAWQVTAFMGLQSLGFYSAVAWVPSIYRDLGISGSDAGLLAAIIPLAGILGSLTIPAMAARAADQRLAAIGVGIVTSTGFLGMLLAPLVAPALWVGIIGASQGAGFPLSLTLVVLRTRTPAETQRLSSAAQTLGYILAATGPLIVGALHDATGSWTAPLGVLVLLTVVMGIAGLGAGRARFVGTIAAADRPGAVVP